MTVCRRLLLTLFIGLLSPFVGELLAAETQIPEDQINRYCKALLNDDFLSILNTKEAEIKTRIEQQWQLSTDSIDDESAHSFNASLSLLLATDAPEKLQQLAAPYLAQIDKAVISEYIQKLSDIIAQDYSKKLETLSADEKHLIKTFQIMAADTAAWVLGSTINDAQKLNLAIKECCKTSASLKINSMNDLKKLSLEEALGKLSLLNKGIKNLCLIYDIDLQAFLGSVQASGTEIDANNRNLQLAFTAFGKQHQIRLHLILSNEEWTVESLIRQPRQTP